MNKYNLDLLKGHIARSVGVVKTAIGGKALKLSYGLTDLGKRCGDKWVYRQGEKGTDSPRPNFYSVFLVWIAAFFITENQRGAELLLNDLEMFVRLCRDIVNNRTRTPKLPKEIVQIITRLKVDLSSLEASLVI